MNKLKQNIHGMVLLDKAKGLSSNRALQQVKHLFNAKKAGHTGSLDPLATGLLPICFGQATKISEYLLHSDKKYITVIKLGESTDTYDAEGEILERKAVQVSDSEIESALAQFRGEIKQTPPMYSALKKLGQPLYKLARKGEVVERPQRNMTVHSLIFKRIDATQLQLNVHCSSGFYIRSLAHDLGQALGCGAHVAELRRIAIKTADLSQAVSFEQLQAMESPLQSLQPIDCLLSDMPVLQISESQALSLLQGKNTVISDAAETPLSRLYTSTEKLFGIGKIDQQGRLKTQKIFNRDN